MLIVVIVVRLRRLWRWRLWLRRRRLRSGRWGRSRLRRHIVPRQQRKAATAAALRSPDCKVSAPLDDGAAGIAPVPLRLLPLVLLDACFNPVRIQLLGLSQLLQCRRATHAS